MGLYEGVDLGQQVLAPSEMLEVEISEQAGRVEVGVGKSFVGSNEELVVVPGGEDACQGIPPDGDGSFPGSPGTGGSVGLGHQNQLGGLAGLVSPVVMFPVESRPTATARSPEAITCTLAAGSLSASSQTARTCASSS